MKPRKELTASEVDGLLGRINQHLDHMGIETQPKVALRLVELAQSPDAQLNDYTEAIKTDWAITARILRLANSVYYAQRSPVTRLERAVVLLGLERTKAVTLGFYLSRAALAEDSRELTRAVSGQSVYRASLAAALARVQCPGLAAEAYVVGLMLDCGIPLMGRIVGEEYVKLFQGAETPGKLYEAELATMEFTHVDVASALMRRWQMPGVLARPICWHHTLPPVGKTDEAAVILQRVAYYAGAVRLGAGGVVRQESPLAQVADRLFEIGRGDLERVVEAAGHEYRATVGLFTEAEHALGEVEALGELVQTQLIDILDAQMSRLMRLESMGGSERFVISGHKVEVEPGHDGEVLAYISGACGERLFTCTLRPERDTPESLRRLLGLEDATESEIQELARALRSMAA